MRNSVVGCFAALLLAACASAKPKGEISSLSPSSVVEGEMPPTVLIKGRGLGDLAHVKLDDKGSARITPVTVEVGGVVANVKSHPSRDQIEAEFPPLPPGEYDVRVLTGTEVNAVMAGAFHVESAPSGVSPDDTDDATPSGSQTPSDAGSSNDEAASTSGPGSNVESSQALTSNAGTSGTITDVTAATEPDESSTLGDAAIDSTDVATADAGDGAVTSDVTSESPDAEAPPPACVNAPGTLLFYEDYESGELSRWTSDGNVGQGACQNTFVGNERAFGGGFALDSTLTCAPGNDAEHYLALQFDGDDVLSAFRQNGSGIDAPFGVVISFDVWAELGFTPGTDRWLSLALLSGTCDWSDTVLSVATLGAGAPLGVAHGDANGGTEYDYSGAPVAARSEWSHVTVYVNYYEQVLSVWQDGILASRAEFERPGNTLCHIWLGAAFGANSVDSRVYQDNVTIWRLSAPLSDADSEPCELGPD